MIGGEVTMVIRDDGLFTFEPTGSLVAFEEEGPLVVPVGAGEGAFVVVIVPNGSGSLIRVPGLLGVVDGARVSIIVERVVVFIGLYVVEMGGFVVVVVDGGEVVLFGGAVVV